MLKLYGDDIGFQFAVTGMGSRSVRTTIYNIKEVIEQDIRQIQLNNIALNKNRSSRNKSSKRIIPHKDRFFIGIASPILYGSKRNVKVWGHIYNFEDIELIKWYSYYSYDMNNEVKK